MSSFRDWNSTIKLQLTAGGGERSICFMQISAEEGIEWNGKKIEAIYRRGKNNRRVETVW